LSKIHSVSAQKISGEVHHTYLFALPISITLRLLEIPDPAFPFAGNRRVNKKHAVDFGNYWEFHQGHWVVPPLLLDSSKTLVTRESKAENVLSNLVDIDFEEGKNLEIRILDGQHRILGWYLKQLELQKRLNDSTSTYNKLILSGGMTPDHHVLQELQYLNKQLSRFEEELVAINLIENLDERGHEQFFVDIAKNALGINKTVQSKFDSSSIINRVVKELIENHNLLRGKVDLEKINCSGANPNLLSVVNVADIVRHASFGINTRITAKRESMYQDKDILLNSSLFFDLMKSNFPLLSDLESGRTTTLTIREESLLGSSTMWRCLAGAYFEYCVVIDDEVGFIGTDDSRLGDFEKFLSQLCSVMSYPISSRWFRTGLFPKRESKAPVSRTQDLKNMVDLMCAWASNGELFRPRDLEELNEDIDP